MSGRETHVIVLGGGYAGVMAANRLAERTNVTLVNPRAKFVERIRLHQFAIDNDDAQVDYATILNPAVRFVVDSAERIDAASRRVQLTSGTALEFDYLV